MTQKHNYELLDCDNSTGNYVLIDNGEHIAEFYNADDATLSLSAPELLEALKAMLLLDERKLKKMANAAGYSVDIHLAACKNARAAIAKAEGK